MFINGGPLYLLVYTPYALVCRTLTTRRRPRTVSYSHHHLHPLHEQCKPFSDAADLYVPVFVILGATVGAAVGVAVTVDAAAAIRTVRGSPDGSVVWTATTRL